jgi:hypothetical protein
MTVGVANPVTGRVVGALEVIEPSSAWKSVLACQVYRVLNLNEWHKSRDSQPKLESAAGFTISICIGALPSAGKNVTVTCTDGREMASPGISPESLSPPSLPGRDEVGGVSLISYLAHCASLWPISPLQKIKPRTGAVLLVGLTAAAAEASEVVQAVKEPARQLQSLVSSLGVLLFYGDRWLHRSNETFGIDFQSAGK